MTSNIEEAKLVVEEAKMNGFINSKYLLDKYNNREQLIKDRQEVIKSFAPYAEAKKYEMVDEFNKLKSEYYSEVPLSDLKKIVKNVSVYQRSIVLKEIAKKFAKGVCQLCKNQAPFVDKYGNPFLEVHHIDFLSQGGKDELDNLVALCPNCHRKVHYLPNLNEKIELKKIAFKYMKD